MLTLCTVKTPGMKQLARLAGLPEDEFAESVCLDWMDRRKELGETLDEKEDPKIVPTYEAHNRASRTLVHAITRWLWRACPCRHHRA